MTRCLQLEARYEAWGAVAAASAAVAGGGAITTALPPDSPSRLTLGLSSAALVAVGAAAVFVAQDLLAAYTTEGCGAGAVESSTTAPGKGR